MTAPNRYLACIGGLLAAAAFFPSQGSAAPAALPVAVHADAPGIDWYGGSVDEAFAAAERTGRPVLLYWGAVWCPPCQQLKSTVFSRRDFIEKSHLFVPVYLDGDTAGAQKFGEQFRVSGYPTVVILRPDRSEILRIAGSMDLARYAGMLDLALGDAAPIEATLAAVRPDAALGDADCRRLAWQGWDPGVRKPEENRDLVERLSIAAQRCPLALPLERARLGASAAFLGAQLESAAASKAAAARPFAPSAELAARLRALDATLADPALAAGLTDILLSDSPGIFEAAKALPAPFARQFTDRFVAAMNAAAADSGLAEADRLEALGSKLLALKTLAPDGKLAPEVAAAAHRTVEQAVAGKHEPYVRSGIINSVEFVLDELDDNLRARDIVRAEIATAKAPYYYMAELGDLEEKLGNKAEALHWYERSWRESQGPATRFQWGARYVGALIRLTPDDAPRIAEVAGQVLGELDGPEALYRRSEAVLERLDTKLRAWNGDGRHGEVLTALRTRMQGLCTRIPPQEPSRARCEAFLASRGTAA